MNFMKPPILLFFFLTCMILSSCESLNEDVNDIYSPYDMVEITINHIDLPSYSSRSISPISSLEDYYEVGFSDSHNDSNIKRLFSEELAKTLGLEKDVIYIMRFETYYKTISLNGGVFFDDDYQLYYK